VPERTFGNLLKQRRQELALTQRALADQLGVSSTCVASLETGHRNPSLRMIHRAAESLDLDARKLFLSHLAGAGLQLQSRGDGKAKNAGWPRLAANKALRAKERVSPAEMRVLKQISQLGRIPSERQLLFVLRTIRIALEDEHGWW
jgi:transcriptional regulator with XRE-family HTH domain